MDDITMRRLQTAITDVFSRVSEFNDKEKIIFAFLSTSEAGDICEELTPINIREHHGEYNFKNEKREINARFKKGQLHSLTQAAWVETYDGDKVKKAWVKKDLVLALDINGKKLILDKEQMMLVEDKEGLKFNNIIKEFENRPKLSTASE